MFNCCHWPLVAYRLQTWYSSRIPFFTLNTRGCLHATSSFPSISFCLSTNFTTQDECERHPPDQHCAHSTHQQLLHHPYIIFVAFRQCCSMPCVVSIPQCWYQLCWKAKLSCAVMKLTLSTKQPKPPLLPNISMNMPPVILKQLSTILYSAVVVIPPSQHYVSCADLKYHVVSL